MMRREVNKKQQGKPTLFSLWRHYSVNGQPTVVIPDASDFVSSPAQI